MPKQALPLKHKTAGCYEGSGKIAKLLNCYIEMDVERYLQQKRKIINKALLKFLPKPKGPAKELIEAMRYSVLAGGKRLRPVLMLAIADVLGKPTSQVLKAACAVEYVHTSTLILDDLPCMDDSNLRRGRPSVHKRFGQSTAILTSYSLMALAFGLLAECPKAIEVLSKAIGYGGVCAGQYADLRTGAGRIGMEALMYIHRHKTADLFVAACSIAACILGASARQMRALEAYADELGMAFQLYDDILSIKKTHRQLGKATKKDEHSPNAANLFGMKKTQDLLNRKIEKAKSHLAAFSAKGKILWGILKYVIHREK